MSTLDIPYLIQNMVCPFFWTYHISSMDIPYFCWTCHISSVESKTVLNNFVCSYACTGLFVFDTIISGPFHAHLFQSSLSRMSHFLPSLCGRFLPSVRIWYVKQENLVDIVRLPVLLSVMQCQSFISIICSILWHHIQELFPHTIDVKLDILVIYISYIM